MKKIKIPAETCTKLLIEIVKNFLLNIIPFFCFFFKLLNNMIVIIVNTNNNKYASWYEINSLVKLKL